MIKPMLTRFNVIGYKSTKNPKKIIIQPFDQIGMIVSGFEKGGFLRISNLGGIDTKALLASEVIVHGREEVFGVIGAKPPHLLKEDETKKNVKMTGLFIDTGFPDDILKQKVSIGDPVTMLAPVVTLKNGCIAGKSLDNRTGVAALVLILKELQNMKHPNDIYVIATAGRDRSSGSNNFFIPLEPDLALL